MWPERAERDLNGVPTVIGWDPVNQEVVMIRIEEIARAIRTANMVYSPTDLDWYKMVQPATQPDLIPIEDATSWQYWKVIKWEWNTVRVLPLYQGRHVLADAPNDDLEHFITKWTWHPGVNAPTLIQTATGSWDDRASYF